MILLGEIEQCEGILDKNYSYINYYYVVYNNDYISYIE